MSTAPQLELNLGDHCNNRCVFCLCGQLTEQGLAEPNPVDTLRTELDRAKAQGMRRVTFLGGEPTLQPGFDELMAYAVTLGFDELIIFTNGARTGKRAFIERMAALGSFTWRFSIQGGDELTHDRNTKRPGSFKRIVHGLEVLRELGQRTTVNTCVNANNVESLQLFPDLLTRYGVTQFHADMVRPHSTGDRSEEEVAALLPDYGRLRVRFTEMMDGFARVDAPIEVRIGNLPFCVLPEFATDIQHGGEFTLTVAGNGYGELRDPLDKYDYQREQHQHPPACTGCLMRHRCKGVPDIMAERGDLTLLQPVTLATLRGVSPQRRDLLALVFAYLNAERPAGSPEPMPTGYAIESVLPSEGRAVEVSLTTPSGAATFVCSPPGVARVLARTPDFGLALKVTHASPADTARAYASLVRQLELAQLGAVEVALSPSQLVEALMPPEQRSSGMLELARVLRRLRQSSSFLATRRLGAKHSLSDAFGVGFTVFDANGDAGRVRLVLGSGAENPVHAEFDGGISAETRRLVNAAMGRGAVHEAAEPAPHAEP